MTGFESFLLSMLLNILIMELTPKPDLPQAKRYGLNDFSLPTATEDRAHSVGFGTFKVAGNVIWFGDYNAVPVTESIHVSLFQSKTLTKGYQYRMGLWMSLCGVPCDELQEIRLGDYVVWSGKQELSKSDVTAVNINKRWTQAEGQDVPDGMVGTFLFYNHRVREGEDYTPLENPYIESILGSGNVPAYPNTLHVVWLGPQAVTNSILENMVADAINTAVGGIFGMVSTSPAVQPFSFVLKRMPDISDVLSQAIPFVPGTAYQDMISSKFDPLMDVNGDANPAYVQLEVLTSRVPGLGPRMTNWAVELSSFQAAAARYKAEGHGVSFAWEVSRPVAGLIGDLGMQTNSVMEVQEHTGQLRTKLLRQDDTPVAVFDETNLISIATFTRVSVDQAPNRVEVPFVDRSNNWIERVAIAKNDAAVKMAGTIIDQRAEFIGVSRESLAQYLATREMAKVSAPLAKASFTGWLPVGIVLKPGDLITFRHPKLEQTLRMRVVSARFGDYARALRVDVDAIEDVFKPGYNFTVGANPLQPNAPIPNPTALTEPELMLAPYALTGDDADHALYVANDPGTGVNSYRLSVQNGAGWSDTTSRAFMDTEQEPALKSVMETSMGSLEASPVLMLTLSNDETQQWRRSTRGALFVIVGNEWMRCSDWTLSGNTLTAATVERAVFDTIPERHEMGDSVRVLLGFVVVATRMRTQGASGLAATDGAASVTVRAESRGPQGVLDVALASGSQASLTTVVGQARAPAPLLPGLVKLSDTLGALTSAETIPTVTSAPTMTLTWNNRNRLSRLVGSWFSDGNSAESDSFTAVHLEYQNLDAGWTDGGWHFPPLMASSCELETKDIPAHALIRITIEARRNYGEGDGRTISSKPMVLAWQIA